MRPAGALEGLEVIVLCGGQGTRLGRLTAQTPKPLLPVGGFPFLLHRLQVLKGAGSGRVILAVHYLADQFRAFADRYASSVPALTIVEEPTPLGTGGALRHALAAVQTIRFAAFNGDSWLEQPLRPVLTQHLQRGASFTMVVVPAAQLVGGARRKGVVTIGPNQEILGCSTPEVIVDGWVNAGCYVLETALVQRWPSGRYDLEQELMSLVPLGEGQVFYSSSSLVDIGTPECYARAQQVVHA